MTVESDQDRAALAGEFALGVLTGDERLAAAERAATDPGVRARSRSLAQPAGPARQSNRTA